MSQVKPRLAVFTTLFPTREQPTSGLFIRERMFRVARDFPVVVVTPRPWFPFQSLIRLFKPGYRPKAPYHEKQHNIDVFQPRFLSIPYLGKSLDGLLMALSLYWPMRRLHSRFAYSIIDAHFGYPDGYAAVRLGHWLNCPVTITMRGTEARHAENKKLRPVLCKALVGATRVFTVSDSLRNLALELGVDPEKAQTISNGVDSEKFYPLNRSAMRARFGLSDDARVLVTVGGLVERKGFHRVIELMPSLSKRFPDLYYLVVGGACAEGNWEARLKSQADALGLREKVLFLGPLPPEQLREPLSCADVFVLPSRNEGWANVLLEAMACGLPVVTTDVGGSAEVVSLKELGTVVPFGDTTLLEDAIAEALDRDWGHKIIEDYARKNSWDKRIDLLKETLIDVAGSQLDCLPEGRRAGTG
ncbi:MAG: glycosyltransferase [Pseudomonadota bacterium]